ncbi:MAG TPA: dihydrolipoamide acetyltransferase family protein [Pyrinomonadaceae bacterium]|nr:dihydrolipoamide acetyltransferase family protein [Pyrinomonadaceae bacterium]
MATEVVMPQMGESIAEGTITKWLKNVGDHVDRDEPLFEISTDKVDAEIPSPAAGTLTEVRYKEGDTVEVNTVVAVLDGAGAAAPAPPAEKEAAAAASAETPPAPPETASAPALPEPPKPEPAMTIERPKPAITSEPAPAVHKTEVKTLVKKHDAPAAAKPAPASEKTGEESSAADLRRTKSSPLVRKIASEHGIDIKQLEGTGMSGRVTKNDILSFIESGSPATQPASAPVKAAPASAAATQAQPAAQPAPAVKPGEGDRVEQMTVMRKKIAEHMIQSRRTSAHVSTVYEIDMTKIAKLRDEHREAFLERTGTKLTFMPFIFKAVTDAIRKFPIFNTQVSGDQIIYKRDINLGMAVALDWGLIVPVIKRADDLSISGLARAANDLADRARTKQLKPDEVAGGTFTITNPGVFGGLFGTPIINQPQVAILGVGKIEKRARVLTSADGEDYIAIRQMAYFALSFDHRIIDGSDAEKFLAYVKERLESGEFSI